MTAKSLLCLLFLLLPTFGGAQTPATFAYPQNGDQAVDTTLPFKWNAVPNAEAYYVVIGTKQGSRDLYQSGAINTTSLLVPALPGGVTLNGRLSKIGRAHV